MGNLVTSAQLAIAKKSGYDVDFAMTNNGGIRADLKVQEDGTVTWEQHAVQPFGNILQVVQMTGEQIYKALNQQYDEGENISFKCLESNISTRKQIIQRKKILTRLLKPSKKMERRLFRQKPIHLSSMTFIWWWDGFSIFKEAKLIGAINPDTEVFVEYLTDLEKQVKPLVQLLQVEKHL